MRFDRERYCLTLAGTVRDASACIDANPAKIALVVDEEYRLLDTITDGDIRRAILAGLSLESPVSGLQTCKLQSVGRQPITAPASADAAHLLRLFRETRVRQIPLLDSESRVVDVITVDQLIDRTLLPVRAVIMAGGFGTRLRPLTDDLPKPMLPVGDRPLLEVIVERLCSAGIRHITFLTHYKEEAIREHFQDGSRFGVDIEYVLEETPLGTAGALSLLTPGNEPLLVLNGDILTKVDFTSLYEFHRDHAADITVAVREYDFRVPYGVVEGVGERVERISEKPIVRYFVNAGIYLLRPEICARLQHNTHCDMPTLINGCVAAGLAVVSFPIREYWLDIGQMDDYRKADGDLRRGDA